MSHKTIIFDADVEKEPISELIDAIEELEPEQEATVYFSTDGGTIYLMDILLDCFNRNPHIEIVLTNQLNSTGFDILECNNPIRLGSAFAFAMVHPADNEASLKELAAGRNSCAKALQQNIERLWKEDPARKWMTAKQLREYNKGVDLYLNYTEMQRILDKRNKKL